METSGYAGTPLARLVLFMVCLSVAGSCIAGVLFYAGQSQQELQAPENSIFPTDCAKGLTACHAFCDKVGSAPAINKCYRWCNSHC